MWREQLIKVFLTLASPHLFFSQKRNCFLSLRFPHQKKWFFFFSKKQQRNTRFLHSPLKTHLFQIQNIIQTTSVLTAAILIYARRAGITAAAGTRLALFLFLVKNFILFSFQLELFIWTLLLLFFVTASRCPYWAIFAPAATLRCSSYFSCSLSGTKPLFSVSVTN